MNKFTGDRLNGTLRNYQGQFLWLLSYAGSKKVTPPEGHERKNPRFRISVRNDTKKTINYSPSPYPSPARGEGMKKNIKKRLYRIGYSP